MSDITIVINGHKIPAHKIVLSSCSHVFETMFLSQFRESNDKEIEIKDTNIDAFKVFLKYCYFYDLDSNHIKDYSLAFDVFRLSHRFQVKDLMDLIEKKLFSMITIENILIICEFALIFDLNDLLIALKMIFDQNKYQIIEQKLILNNSFELIEKFLNFAELSPKELITVLIQIADKNPEKDLKRFRKLIDFDLCSVRELNALRNIRVFEEKVLNEWIERKFEDLENLNKELTQSIRESKDKYEELMDNYKEAKQFFEPFMNFEEFVVVKDCEYQNIGSARYRYPDFEFKF